MLYIYYINFVYRVQKCQYIYIKNKIKTRHIFLNELYFGFFQTFEDSIK